MAVQQLVEVMRTEAGLRIHIECLMRPGLLLAIMELLESSGLTVEEASVECVERLVFHGLGLEVFSIRFADTSVYKLFWCSTSRLLTSEITGSPKFY